MGYILVFDGGKNKQGTYFSFLIFKGDKLIGRGNRISEQVKTSNEAEYLALIRALESLQSNYSGEEVLILGDSRLVINQLNGLWQVSSESLKPFSQRASDLIGQIDCKLIWWPGDQSKQFLGH